MSNLFLKLCSTAVLVPVPYVAFALPASNATSDATNASLTLSPPCNDILHCRTLAGLVWSCLTTIFLCTWVALHPNVPAAKGSRGFLDRIFSTRLGLMCLMLASPELVVLLASNDWALASNLITTLSRWSISLLLFHSSLIHLRKISGDSMDRDARHDGGDGWI